MVKYNGPTRIGELLLRKGLIRPDQLGFAIQEQHRRREANCVSSRVNKPDTTALGEILIELNIVSRQDVEKCLGWQSQLRRVTCAMVLAAPLLSAVMPAAAAPKKFTDPTYTSTQEYEVKGNGKAGGRWVESTTEPDSTVSSPVEEPVSIDDPNVVDGSVTTAEDPVAVQDTTSEPTVDETVTVDETIVSTTEEPLVDESTVVDSSTVIVEESVEEPVIETITEEPLVEDVAADTTTSDPIVEVIDVVDTSTTESVTPAVSSLQLSWAAPDSRENGTALNPSDIGGYEILYRNGSEEYRSILIYNGELTEHTIDGITAGEYEFKIAAFDLDGVYSDFSPPIIRSVQ